MVNQQHSEAAAELQHQNDLRELQADDVQLATLTRKVTCDHLDTSESVKVVERKESLPY